MPKRRQRRHKKTSVSLKRETVLSIIGILIVSLGCLVSVSFSRQGVILQTVFNLGSRYLGWTFILVPFLFISSGLILSRVKWGLARFSTFLGYLIVLISSLGLTKAGEIGHQLFLSIASLINPAGSYLFYLTGLAIGIIIFFETSLQDLSIFFRNIFNKITQLLQTKVTRNRLDQVSHLGSKEIKVKGIPQELETESTSSQKLEKKPPTPFVVNANRPPETPTVGTVVSNQPTGSSTVWELPPLSILSDEKRGKADRGDIKHNAAVIERTLDSFGIEAKVIEVNCGPAVTQYALEIALGTKVSKIVTLQSDLALALAAPQGQIRIEAPIAGRSLVGIEIPNRSLEYVSLKQILTSPIMQKNTSKTAVALGIDVSGDAAVAEISKMPHVLIAGSTGSGKSVCLNAFIASILFRASPDEVKFIMVDPKRVELTGYNGIPHLLTPVIVEPDKVISALKWALAEMENRYKLFAEVGVRNIAGYNSLSGFQAMPYIIFLIDELADIMLYSVSEVEEAVTRLAQMARAVGIHLVVATQRPSVDILTGLIKANIPCRIAFNVTSMVDSRVIIDTPGAEKLLGRGDMLYIPPDQAKPHRIQGAYVDDAEITGLTSYLRSKGVAPQYQDAVTTSYQSKKSISSNPNIEDVDEQFQQSVRVCVEYGKASASLLQRRLSIGYARAARILDQLEQAGVISAPEGSKPRDVLIKNAEEFLASYRN